MLMIFYFLIISCCLLTASIQVVLNKLPGPTHPVAVTRSSLATRRLWDDGILVMDK